MLLLSQAWLANSSFILYFIYERQGLVVARAGISIQRVAEIDVKLFCFRRQGVGFGGMCHHVPLKAVF